MGIQFLGIGTGEIHMGETASVKHQAVVACVGMGETASVKHPAVVAIWGIDRG